MKRYFFLAFILFICGFMALGAEVGVLAITTEDAHTKKEDFWHTFEYYIVAPNGQTSKCQATRIAKKWFATAAHCVIDSCKNGCTLSIDLLEQPISALVSAKHTAKKPIAFVHPKYQEQDAIQYDFALLHLDPARLPARYYRRPQGKETHNVEISRKQFERFLQQQPTARWEFDRVLRPILPPILIFDGETRRIDRTLSVISIFDGQRQILHNPYPTDYVKELGFAYTKNFGIRKGMSGSGVMTNTGELAGIISAYLGVSAGGKEKDEYFMFAAFNPDLASFMEETMGSDYYNTERIDAYPHYVVKTRANHRDVINGVRSLSKQKSKPKSSSSR